MNQPANLGDATHDLSQLGSKTTDYEFAEVNAGLLETFENQFPAGEYEVKFTTEEFTSLCPKTHQPDFGKITIEYVPQFRCIETKSLKLYLFSFRNTGSFMETIVNTICRDLVECCNPKFMRVNGCFKVRGGVEVDVTAVYTNIDDDDFEEEHF